jgi:hypothetical protein
MELDSEMKGGVRERFEMLITATALGFTTRANDFRGN